MLIGKIAELLCFKRNIALYKSKYLIQFLFISPVPELAWVSPMSTLMGVWTLTCKKCSVFVHENPLPLSRQHLPGVPTAHNAIMNCEERGSPQSKICQCMCTYSLTWLFYICCSEIASKRSQTSPPFCSSQKILHLLKYITSENISRTFSHQHQDFHEEKHRSPSFSSSNCCTCDAGLSKLNSISKKGPQAKLGVHMDYLPFFKRVLYVKFQLVPDFFNSIGRMRLEVEH